MNSTMLLKELPEEERPYERCRRFGPESLTDAQLVSVILRTGSRGENALALASRILSCPEAPGLEGLCHQTYQKLREIRGIGDVKALQLLCITELSRRIYRRGLCGFEEGVFFRDPNMVVAYYMEEYRHETQEKVLLVMLDNKGRLIADKVVFIGTVNTALVSPREIFLTALGHRAVTIILLHNHPSGDPTPSEEDIRMTERVSRGGELLGITLTDHIIIGDQKAVSFRQEGLLSVAQ